MMTIFITAVTRWSITTAERSTCVAVHAVWEVALHLVVRSIGFQIIFHISQNSWVSCLLKLSIVIGGVFFNKRKSSDFKNLCGLIHEAICTEEMLTSTGVAVPVPSKVTIPVRKFPTFSHFLLTELPLLCAVEQVGVVTWLPSLAYI